MAANDFELQAAFESAARLLGVGGYGIEAKFKEYAGLKANIRREGKRIVANVSDGYADLNLEQLTGLAIDLLAKLFKYREVPELAGKYLEEFNSLNGKGAHRLNEQLRKTRGRKRDAGGTGEAYDLNLLLDKVLGDYAELFREVERPDIVWSRNESKRRLAFYDSAFNQIIVSRKFDSPKAPQFFLEYLIYHELLHAKHEPAYSTRRRVHHRNFKGDEKNFLRYHEAIAYMERN